MVTMLTYGLVDLKVKFSSGSYVRLAALLCTYYLDKLLVGKQNKKWQVKETKEH